jgi:hypothetical protein
MSTDKLRFAVLMDIAFSVFQEEPFIGVKRYLDAVSGYDFAGRV